jgi:transcriptional regulator GlxA family with amidase domain
MHRVTVLALDGVVAFDLATPLEVFGRVRLPDGSRPYDVRVCAPHPEVGAGLFTVKVAHGLEALDDADTIMLPGCHEPVHGVPQDVVARLRGAARRGTRLASICSGAFVLAATGLLDGKRATTHWAGVAAFGAMHPEVEVDPDVLYVDNGQFLTSAGAAAGLDLCLHIIRRDFGSAVAADAARLSVMPLERDGGQAQFIVPEQPPVPRGSEFEPLLVWMDESSGRDLTLAEIASRAGMSTRTLNRRFREQTGTTPLQWLHRARIRRAQHLLETTSRPVDRIGGQVGFGSPTAFRDRFKRVVGTSPHSYRRAFRSGFASAGQGILSVSPQTSAGSPQAGPGVAAERPGRGT